MVIHPLVIIRTANTETQSAVGHVPKERFEIPPRGIRHTIRAQLAQYENAIGRSEWVIGRHHAVAVGAGTNQSAMGYGKLSLRVEDVDGHGDAIAHLRVACVPCDNLESRCRMSVRDQ